jgi:LysR family transcriptional regulator, mexEF-oprN operon transcriptional activator
MGSMSRITIGELRKLDLNLLVVFVAMMEEGSVTKTAERLALTQPAISACLTRLREALGAALFVRVGRGLVPTARAHALVAEVGPALEALGQGLFAREPFRPETAERVFRLGVPDDLEMLLVPSLVAALRTKAPRARLLVRPIDFRTAAAALESEAVELCVSVFDDLPAHIVREQMPSGGYVCLFDPRKVRLPRRPTLAQYLARAHVVVSYNGDMQGFVEDALGGRGIARDVVLSLPRFSAIPSILKSAPLVATLPEALARKFAKEHRLQVAPLPFELPRHALEMAWHRARDRDDGHAWLRGEVMRALATSPVGQRAS